MVKTFNRVTSMMLTVAMLLSLMPANVLALVANDPTSFAVTNAEVVIDGDEDKIVEIQFYGTSADSYSGVNGTLDTTAANGSIVLTELIANYEVDGESSYAYINTQDVSKPSYFKLAAITTGKAYEANEKIITARYTVSRDIVPGVYPVKVSVETAKNMGGAVLKNATYTATITVTDSSSGEEGGDPVDPDPGATAPYEIYYTLDKTDSNDEGSYAEYDANTVTATVHMKNNTGAAVTMQAYDIYLTHSKYLVYSSDTMAGVEHTSDTMTHIQLVKNNTATVVLAKDQATTLGTVVFTIDPTNVPDGKEMDLTIAVAADTENTAKEEQVTNFAITDDQRSYYPADISQLDGVEMAAYTVTYDVNGGEGTFEDQTKYYGKGLTLHSTVPTRTGYDFQGWKAADGTEYAAGETYVGNADLALTAQWKAQTFTVTWYDAESVKIYDQSADYNSTVSFDENKGSKPSKDADAQYTYSFKGWTTDSAPELNAEVLDLTTYKITAATNLYPVFSTVTKTYTVIWQNYDGTELEKDGNVSYGTMPKYDGDIPERTATAAIVYEFAGWDPAVDKVTGNVTYTATFTESTRTYTVRFAAGENGTLANADNQTVAFGSKPVYPTATANDGYTFDGWYDGDTKIETTDYTVTGEVTLTAKFVAKKYTVTFNSNGGDGTMEPQEFTHGVEQALKANSFTAPTGKTFVGWKDAEGKPYDAGQVVTLTGDITLYAQWDNVKYTVTVNPSDKGTVSANPAGGNYQTEITLTITPASGYELDTLTVKDAFGAEVTRTDNKFTMPASDVTVTATFKPINYTVSIGSISNGSVSADETQNLHVGDEVVLTPTANTGYKWVSYTVTYGDGQSVAVTDNKFTMPAGNVTVTAVFEGIGYTVNFDKNATDATGTVNAIGAVYGQSITLSDAKFSRPGYNFLGWSIDKNATEATYAAGATIGANLYTPTGEGESATLYAVWQAIPYDVDVDTDADGNGTISATPDPATVGKTVTLRDTPNPGYELEKYIVTDANDAEVTVTDGTFIMPAGPVKVTATFKPISYNVIVINPTDGNGTVVADPTQTTIGQTVILSNTPNPGYELGSYSVTYMDAENNEQTVEVIEGKFTMPAAEVKVTASFNPIQYTITLNANGGEVDPDTITYDVTGTATLPTPTRTNWEFKGWTLDANTGNWDAGNYNADTYTGKYGVKDQEMVLTAQWVKALTVTVEDYKYAVDGYVMIRVADTLKSDQEYKFNGASMYYMSAADDTESVYLVDSGDSGVFYTLIPKTGENDVEYVNGNALTDDGYALLTVGSCDTRTEIDYDGDINGDDVVNIADANAVYQMVQNGGSYYSLDQLDTLARLKADMATAIGENTDECRGSIADVNAILAEINGTAPAEDGAQ